MPGAVTKWTTLSDGPVRLSLVEGGPTPRTPDFGGHVRLPRLPRAGANPLYFPGPQVRPMAAAKTCGLGQVRGGEPPLRAGNQIAGEFLNQATLRLATSTCTPGPMLELSDTFFT
jgi:hypothetical protein